MSKKRKISVRRVLRAFVTLVVTTSCLVAVLGASRMQQSKTLNKVTLHVRNENRYQFLDKQALWNDLVEQQGIKEKKTKLARLDIKAVERKAYRNAWVSEAQVFVDNKRNMHINVTQRVPVARIFFENGQSFYLDASLRLLPLSELFTYYTTIVTNVPVLETDSMNRDLRAQIVKMVGFVEKDSFWSAQIAQIDVTPDRKFELVPVLGTHKILFGDTAGMKNKFSNLFAFYKNVLNRIGWDKYETLDLRFRDQVVASPALAWKPPTKNAISNMDWVKSIMGDAPADTAKPLRMPVVAMPDKKPVTVVPPKPTVVAPDKKPVATAQVKPKAPAAPAVKPKTTPKKEEKNKTKEDNTPAKGKYIYQGNANN